MLNAGIYNIKGEKVLETNLNDNTTNIIDVSMLVPGSYIVRILSNGKIEKTVKVTKE